MGGGPVLPEQGATVVSEPAARPTRCIRCNYLLDGLGEDALCPECAVPVRLSRTGRTFADLDTGTLTRSLGGVQLLIGAALASWLHALLGIVAIASLEADAAGPASAAACSIPAIVALLAWWAGWWLLTSSRSDLPFHRRWRRVSVRLLCGVHAFGTMILVLDMLRPGAVSPVMDSVLIALGQLSLWSAPFVWATTVIGMAILSDLAVLGQAPGSIPVRAFGWAMHGVGFVLALTFVGWVLLRPLGYLMGVLAIGGFVGVAIAWPLMLIGVQDPIRSVLRERGATA